MDFNASSLFPGMDGNGSNATPFASPFYDWTISWMPRNVDGMFKWCEYLYKRNGIVRQAIKRIAEYPVTDLRFANESTTVTDKYKDFLENLNYRSVAICMGTDLLVYGNSITSVYLPFKRFLKCGSCRAKTPSDKVEDWSFKNFEFNGKCGTCGVVGVMKHEDRKSYDYKEVHIIRWDPKFVDIRLNKYSGKATYFYRIPPEDNQRITEGDRDMIESTPWGLIESVKEKKKFKFNREALLHLKMPALAGDMQEWGMSLLINIFQLHFHAAIARRANEGIFLDFAIPTRVIYPDMKSQAQEPTDYIDLGDFKGEMEKMLRAKRKDNLHVKISPVPIGYQTIGGEAKALNLFNEMIKKAGISPGL